MKTKTKIIIFTCVIFILIGMMILSSFLPKAKEKQQASSNTINNTTSPINVDQNGNNDGNNYVEITYAATSEVFKIDGTDKTITVYQDFPTVVADDENVKNKIQADLGKIANEEFSAYKKEVQERIDDPTGIDASYMENFGNLSLKWSFSNSRNDDKVISVKNESSGSLGGVSWDDVKGYSYSAETGDRLTINTIAINPDALKKYVNENIIKYFRANYQQLGIQQDVLSSLDEKINLDNLDWYFTSSGLTICFGKYYISPNSFEYTIKYGDLKDLVKEEYLK